MAQIIAKGRRSNDGTTAQDALDTTLGHVPSVQAGIAKLAHLEAHGPTAGAFTFKTVFSPEESSG